MHVTENLSGTVTLATATWYSKLDLASTALTGIAPVPPVISVNGFSSNLSTNSKDDKVDLTFNVAEHFSGVSFYWDIPCGDTYSASTFK